MFDFDMFDPYCDRFDCSYHDDYIEHSSGSNNSNQSNSDPSAIVNLLVGLAGVAIAGLTLFTTIRGANNVNNSRRYQRPAQSLQPIGYEQQMAYQQPVQPYPVYQEPVYVQQPVVQPVPQYIPPVQPVPQYVPQPIPEPVQQPVPQTYPWGYNAYINSIANTPMQTQMYYPYQNQTGYNTSQQTFGYNTDYGRNRVVLQSSLLSNAPPVIIEHPQPQNVGAAQFNNYVQAPGYRVTQPPQFNAYPEFHYKHPESVQPVNTYSASQNVSPLLRPTEQPQQTVQQPNNGYMSYLKEREIMKNSHARQYSDGSVSFCKIPDCYNNQGQWIGWK